MPRVDKWGKESSSIRFSSGDCGACPSQAQCIRSRAKHPRRSIVVRPRPQQEALLARRKREGTREYQIAYARRAGIEGTISQGTRRCGLRRTRYLGLARTHLAQVLTAAALNFVRVADHLAGTERSRTRPSRFATLMAVH